LGRGRGGERGGAPARRARFSREVSHLPLLAGAQFFCEGTTDKKNAFFIRWKGIRQLLRLQQRSCRPAQRPAPPPRAHPAVMFALRTLHAPLWSVATARSKFSPILAIRFHQFHQSRPRISFASIFRANPVCSVLVQQDVTGENHAPDFCC
jgi:hypothetical protein